MNGASFDAVYVQFYNNACGVAHYGTSAWNFGVSYTRSLAWILVIDGVVIFQTWDYWANRISPNKNIKVYLGVPAAAGAAGGGSYVPASTITPIVQNLRASFPSFGGVMFWCVQ